MIGNNFQHICGFTNGIPSPYNRLLKRDRKCIPDLDMLGIREAPPLIIDYYTLVEILARLFFVYDNRENPAALEVDFNFWSSCLLSDSLKHIADSLQRRLKSVETTLSMFAVKRNFAPSSYEWSFPTVTPINLDNEFARDAVPRVSDPAKIPSGHILNGNDFRAIYKDLNEMRRFLIPLDSVRGYNEELHKVGNYTAKSRALYPKMFVGPYVEGSTADYISLSIEVTWRNGSIYSRSFPSSFTAKIAGDNQHLNGTSYYARTFAGDVMQYGSPRLLMVWYANLFESVSILRGQVRAITEIPLSVVSRNASLPVWSFNLNLSDLFDSDILARVRRLRPEWSISGEQARLSFNVDHFIFDTGVTNFSHLCPDGWDYTPTA